jgi:hypothetical protein
VEHHGIRRSKRVIVQGPEIHSWPPVKHEECQRKAKNAQTFEFRHFPNNGGIQCGLSGISHAKDNPRLLLLCVHVFEMIRQRPRPIMVKFVKIIDVTPGLGTHRVKHSLAALGARGKEYLQDE